MKKLMMLGIIAAGALLMGGTRTADAGQFVGGVYYATPYAPHAGYDYYEPVYPDYGTYGAYYGGGYYYAPGYNVFNPGVNIRIGGPRPYYGRPMGYRGYYNNRPYRRW